jgi:hypothetical protein
VLIIATFGFFQNVSPFFIVDMLGTKAAATSADRLKVILSHLPKKPGNIPFDFLVSFFQKPSA